MISNDTTLILLRKDIQIFCVRCSFIKKLQRKVQKERNLSSSILDRCLSSRFGGTRTHNPPDLSVTRDTWVYYHLFYLLHESDFTTVLLSSGLIHFPTPPLSFPRKNYIWFWLKYSYLSHSSGTMNHTSEKLGEQERERWGEGGGGQEKEWNG